VEPVPIQFPEEQKSRKGSAYAGNLLDIGLAVSAWYCADRFLDPVAHFDYYPHIKTIGYTLLIAQAVFLPLLIMYRMSGLIGREEELIKKLNNESWVLPVHDGFAMFSFGLSIAGSFALPVFFYLIFKPLIGRDEGVWFLALPLGTAVAAVALSFIPAVTRTVRLIFDRGPGRWLLLLGGVGYIELLQLVLLLIAITPTERNALSGSAAFIFTGFFMGYIPARFTLFYATGRRNLDFNIALISAAIVAWKIIF
jgi:hypothetical protein